MPASENKKTKETSKKKTGESKSSTQFRTFLMVLIPIILLFVVFLVVILPSSTVTVSFPTFKSNFYSAQRVALLVTYHNSSQAVIESQCYTELIQIIAHSRNISTVDFYLMNQTSCTYPIGRFGQPGISLGTNSSANCLARAGSEPELFLNYSDTNNTIVTAYKLSVYGNAQYMASCPIAVDMS